VKLCYSAFRLRLWVLYVLMALYPSTSAAQEKKSLRVVFTGLAWNSELPFRVALARCFLKLKAWRYSRSSLGAVRWLSRRFRPVRLTLPRSATSFSKSPNKNSVPRGG